MNLAMSELVTTLSSSAAPPAPGETQEKYNYNDSNMIYRASRVILD